MYGAIIGDIVGSPYEFDRGKKSKDFPLFSEKSRYTDDSVMTVAICDALMKAGNSCDEDCLKDLFATSMKTWGNRYINAGYGGMFFRWLTSESSEPYGSYGNGSAMRVSSVGWAYSDILYTRKVARWSAEVTHNNPEGIKGAESVASAIFMARHGATNTMIKEYLMSEFQYNLDRTCDEIRPSYSMNATCQGSVPEAIIAFLEGESYEDSIRNAVSLGGDTDTIACITGAIAEAKFGVSESLIKEAMKRLPDPMVKVVENFYGLKG